MSVIEHMGWQIESRSYETNANCWCPRALVSLFEGERVSTHDVRALLTVTFDTAPEADNFAVMMAKMWITERETTAVGELPASTSRTPRRPGCGGPQARTRSWREARGGSPATAAAPDPV